MYTKEALENRLVELDEMQEELSAIQQGFVGGSEVVALEKIYAEYEYDHDDWFSDSFELKSVLGDMERAGV